MYTGKSFESYIRDIQAKGPGATQKVQKTEVTGDIPVRFEPASRPSQYLLSPGFYRENTPGNSVYIAEHLFSYTIGVEQYQSSETIAFDPNGRITTSGTKSRRGRNVLAGGLALIGLGLVAAALGSSSTDSADAPVTTPTPQQPATAPRMADYNLFVSHAWDYSEEYENLLKLLDGVDGFSMKDYSVPKTDPKDVETDAELTRELEKQIRRSSAVIVSAGMYVSHRNWIQKEIRIADEMGKPIIAVKPHGNKRWPRVVKNSATRLVNWNSSSVASAIAVEVGE